MAPATSVSWLSVSEDVQYWLVQAAENRDNLAVANAAMERALALANDHPDALIAAYRYFFYTNNSQMALQIASLVIAQIQAAEQLPDSWDDRKPILSRRLDEPVIRLYLNAYSASGFLHAKLGEVEQAQRIASQIKEIDSKDEFGAALILNILTHSDDDDDD